jgi:crotonobetainyl-CoA:carnitine CoA-transferase CaiB-like acyl-CoA transferase
MAGVFDGIRVLDFCWAIVGPLTTKLLADHGAEVLRVESSVRIDILRSNAPFKDEKPGLNRSQAYATFNTSKRGLGLNLAHPRGRDLARPLIAAWEPDVLAESFAPGTMARLGLDYRSVRELKPDIIYFSTSQSGDSGPFARYAGFGNIGAAVSGYYSLTGWPDRPPTGPFGAVPDMLNPPLAVTAIVAALDYRRRTGRGQRIDLSQIEGSLQFLAPALLDFEASGRVALRAGNRDPYMAPHGVFPCKEGPRHPGGAFDRWLALAVRDDEDWRALCSVSPEEPWAVESRFANFAGRKAREDELEAALAAWTARFDARDLMARLQDAGVPAAAVSDCVDLANDAQLRHLGFFRDLNHPECGAMPYDGPHFELSLTPARLGPAPLLGQDTLAVLRDILRLDDGEIGELLADRVVEAA